MILRSCPIHGRPGILPGPWVLSSNHFLEGSRSLPCLPPAASVPYFSRIPFSPASFSFSVFVCATIRFISGAALSITRVCFPYHRILWAHHRYSLSDDSVKGESDWEVGRSWKFRFTLGSIFLGQTRLPFAPRISKPAWWPVLPKHSFFQCGRSNGTHIPSCSPSQKPLPFQLDLLMSPSEFCTLYVFWARKTGDLADLVMDEMEYLSILRIAVLYCFSFPFSHNFTNRYVGGLKNHCRIPPH